MNSCAVYIQTLLVSYNILDDSEDYAMRIALLSKYSRLPLELKKGLHLRSSIRYQY